MASQEPIDNFRIELLTMEINAKLGALAGIFVGGGGAIGEDLQRNRGGECTDLPKSGLVRPHRNGEVEKANG